MIKYFLIVINSFILFIYGIFNGDGGITITTNMPGNVVAGREIAFDLVVNKGSMNGFAKLQMELPQGFTVKESEDKGATYSYNEGVAKWVWAALPTENEIIIRMVVIPSESNIGLNTITAKYSYVENNVKQVVEMAPVEFTVTGADGEMPVVTQATEPVVEPAKDTIGAVIASVTSNIETPGTLTASRKVETGSTANEYLVNVTIQKGATKGFARFSDDLPNNVIVKDANTDGASFSVADGKIKFVWVNVPDKETLEIAYTISSNVTQKVSLLGEYSYLEDNQSKKFKLPNEELAFEGTQVAEEPKVEQPSKAELAKLDAAAKAEAKKAAKLEAERKAQEKKEQQQLAKENLAKEKELKRQEKLAAAEQKKKGQLSKGEQKKSTQPTFNSSDDKLVYHIQIGAFNKIKVTGTRLEKKFKVSEPIVSEMQGGFSKFMIGTHGEYKEARDHRETVITDNGIKSAFVVAYNMGKRITVQEALMITNQKWFK